MKQKKKITQKVKRFVKRQLIKLFNNYPKIERAFDICDGIFQKLMLGYVIAIVLLLFILFGVAYTTLPYEIKETFSPVISIILTAIVIPFLLSVYSHKKENESKKFEYNKDLYLELTKILTPIVLDKTFTTEIRDNILNHIEKNLAAITISFSSKMIATINSIIKNCNDKDNQNIFYYSKKLIKQIRKESGNTNFSLELLNTNRNNELIKK